VHPRASRGGDMGYIGFHTMAKPFGEKAFGLEVGSFTQKAFKTTLGWHVVYVKDKKIKKIDEVSEHIGMILRNKKYKEWFQLL
jgi:parvulin-like peptidyl-prolyl isomerase